MLSTVLLTTISNSVLFGSSSNYSEESANFFADNKAQQTVSYAYFSDLERVTQEIEQLASSARNGAVIQAKGIVQNFPFGLHCPYVDLDEDGEISFEWILAPDRRLTASTAKYSRLVIAWKNKEQSGYKVLERSVEPIHPFLLEKLREIGNFDA